jgi:hypothetical protein
MPDRAPRNHAIIATEADDWLEMRGNSVMLRFVTDAQLNEMADVGDSYPPAPEGDRVGLTKAERDEIDTYGQHFVLQLEPIVGFALAREYLETLDPQQAQLLRERMSGWGA